MSDVAPAPLCLRCRTVALRRQPESTAGITFFECPTCKRNYAQAAGKGLTFRWLHPISLALHGCVPFSKIRGGEADAVRALVKNKTPEQVGAMAAEIALELDQPTQQVRDILGNAAPEEECRAFLAEVVRLLRTP